MNKRLINIIVLSFSLLLSIQICINVKLYYEKKDLKLSKVNIVIPTYNEDSKKFGFKDILELPKENNNIKIIKLTINTDEETKGNAEIEYNGTKDSFGDVLELINYKENIYSLNSISLKSIDDFTVKAVLNIDFIKNK